MASIHRIISGTPNNHAKLYAGIGLALSVMILVLLVMLLSNSIGHRFYSFDLSLFSFDKNGDKNDMNETTVGTDNTILIKTSGLGWYSADVPKNILAGKPVTFIFELSGSSVNYLVITITGEKGQNLVFLPKPVAFDNNEALFQYTFPSPGVYNVDVTFGPPEGANFNIHVEPKEVGA